MRDRRKAARIGLERLCWRLRRRTESRASSFCQSRIPFLDRLTKGSSCPRRPGGALAWTASGPGSVSATRTTLFGPARMFVSCQGKARRAWRMVSCRRACSASFANDSWRDCVRVRAVLFLVPVEAETGCRRVGQRGVQSRRSHANRGMFPAAPGTHRSVKSSLRRSYFEAAGVKFWPALAAWRLCEFRLSLSAFGAAALALDAVA